MTELSFLVDLLLNHKLPKPTRDAVALRIKEVEGRLAASPPVQWPAAPPTRMTVQPLAAPTAVPAHMVGQSASTIAAMMKHENPVTQQLHEAPPNMPPQDLAQTAAAVPPAPVAVIAQTPMAAAAMADRNAAILAGTAGPFTGKPEKGRTSPRKF